MKNILFIVLGFILGIAITINSIEVTAVNEQEEVIVLTILGNDYVYEYLVD